MGIEGPQLHGSNFRMLRIPRGPICGGSGFISSPSERRYPRESKRMHRTNHSRRQANMFVMERTFGILSTPRVLLDGRQLSRKVNLLCSSEMLKGCWCGRYHLMRLVRLNLRHLKRRFNITDVLFVQADPAAISWRRRSTPHQLRVPAGRTILHHFIAKGEAVLGLCDGGSQRQSRWGTVVEVDCSVSALPRDNFQPDEGTFRPVWLSAATCGGDATRISALEFLCGLFRTFWTDLLQVQNQGVLLHVGRLGTKRCSSLPSRPAGDHFHRDACLRRTRNEVAQNGGEYSPKLVGSNNAFLPRFLRPSRFPLSDRGFSFRECPRAYTTSWPVA